MHDLTGQFALVTGGTAGLGKAIAGKLARRGASVVIVGRDAGRGAATAAELGAGMGQGRVTFLQGDVMTQAGVRTLAAEYTKRHDRLHVLINNAGLLFAERTLTQDGIEANLAVHALAPLLLTFCLRQTLAAGASAERRARVVNTSAGSHKLGRLNLDDLHASQRYAPMGQYNMAKMVSLMLGFHLAEMLKKEHITVNAVDPGGVKSDLLRQAPVPRWAKPLLPLLERFVAKTPEVAAEPFLAVATEARFENLTGQYFSPAAKIARPAKVTRDSAVATRVWSLCTQAAGVPGQF